MKSTLTRGVMLAAASALTLSMAACGSDDSAGTASDSGSSSSSSDSSMESSSPSAEAMSEEPFGAACSQVPTSGEGSVEGMTDDPVATAASNNPLLATLVQAVTARGRRAFAMEADVAKTAQTRAFAGAAERALGPCDVLVNNAGINIRGPFEDLTEEVFDRVRDVHVKGMVFMARAVYPGMVARVGDRLLDAWIFGGGGGALRGVICGGRRVVEAGRHHARPQVAARFARTMRRLLG